MPDSKKRDFALSAMETTSRFLRLGGVALAAVCSLTALCAGQSIFIVLGFAGVSAAFLLLYLNNRPGTPRPPSRPQDHRLG
jgi:hypothetical protein